MTRPPFKSSSSKIGSMTIPKWLLNNNKAKMLRDQEKDLTASLQAVT